MNSKDLETVLVVTELVAKVGMPMIDSILKAISEKSPTIDQIYKLRKTIKDPETYFEEDGSIKKIK
jgi:hypothetical protein